MTTTTIWRYDDMCRHWGVSRATLERWVRQFETHGTGIPVHRDPSGRPYWIAEEAAGDSAQATPSVTRPDAPAGDERVQQLRRAARRTRRRP